MTSGFDVAHCAGCAREVLLTYDLVGDDLVRRCVHCNALVEAAPRVAAAGELGELGYDVPGESAPHGERGCRDGQCGVRQPQPNDR